MNNLEGGNNAKIKEDLIKETFHSDLGRFNLNKLKDLGFLGEDAMKVINEEIGKINDNYDLYSYVSYVDKAEEVNLRNNPETKEYTNCFIAKEEEEDRQHGNEEYVQGSIYITVKKYKLSPDFQSIITKMQTEEKERADKMANINRDNRW